MSESVSTQVKDILPTAKNSPILALGIGILFLIIVIVIEIFKPGLITGTIRKGLSYVGVKGAA